MSEHRDKYRPIEIEPRPEETSELPPTMPLRDKLDDTLIQQLLSELDYYPTDTEVHRVVQPLFEQLRAQLGSEFEDAELLIIHSSELLAFASSEQGRRFVAISDAMVQTLGTPESVSALLAHELTHIENEDRVPERYGNATALDALRKVGKERRQEALADYRPLALLDAAGIDPYALVRAFERTIEPGTIDPEHGSRDERIANAIEVFNFVPFVHIGRGETTFNWSDNAFAQYRCLGDYHEHSDSLHPIEQGQYIIKWRNELIRKQMSQGKNSPLYNQEWQAFVSYVQQTLMFHSSELTKETVCYPMMAVLQGNQRIQDTLTSSLEEQDEQTVLRERLKTR